MQNLDDEYVPIMIKLTKSIKDVLARNFLFLVLLGVLGPEK